MTEALNAIGSALLILAVPFMLGICVGVEIVNRRRNAEAGLGRAYMDNLKGIRTTINFTGPGCRVTERREFILNGIAYEWTLTGQAAPKPVQPDLLGDAA